MMACFLDDPAQVTVAQMNEWSREFNNWAIVDTVCFHLFDKTPHVWKMIPKWAKATGEFQKRASFALIWALSVHDKTSGDKEFLRGLQIMAECAGDERHFVKKAIDMALRAVGKRNARLHLAAIETAEGLTRSASPSAQWIGRHALKELRTRQPRKTAEEREIPQ
jgi:3-methyladenine DNA glycosylase AlkD